MNYVHAVHMLLSSTARIDQLSRPHTEFPHAAGPGANKHFMVIMIKVKCKSKTSIKILKKSNFGYIYKLSVYKTNINCFLFGAWLKLFLLDDDLKTMSVPLGFASGHSHSFEIILGKLFCIMYHYYVFQSPERNH